MDKIYKILVISFVSLLISACTGWGGKIDKKNVSSASTAVSNNASNQAGYINSTAATNSSLITKTMKP